MLLLLHWALVIMAQDILQTTTGCNTDWYNSSAVYTLHAIGVTTGRNTGINTGQSVYTQLKRREMIYRSSGSYFFEETC